MDKGSEIRAMMSDLEKGLNEFENTYQAISLDLKLDFSELVIKGLRKKKWTYTQLAEAIITKNSYINRVVHADQNCTLDVIGRICYALDIKPKLINLNETRISSKLMVAETGKLTIKSIKSGESYGQETITTHNATSNSNGTYRPPAKAA